jgi:hypothetical protein
MIEIFNKFYGLIEIDKRKFNNSSILNPNITDKQFLNIIYRINDLRSLYQYMINSDKRNNTTVERILEKFCICYIDEIKNNLDLFIDILLIYFNILLGYNINYNIIYNNLKSQLKKKHNHQIIYNIKKTIIKY